MTASTHIRRDRSRTSERRPRVVVGVDTHKHVHVAVALDELGTVLANLTVTADRAGYDKVLNWATGLGRVVAFGIEGTGSYGAGLASAARRRGHRVVEVARPDRRERRLRGKNDLLDAENAARAVLSGRADAAPKHADGVVEQIRQIKAAKDTAVKARTAAMITLKALLITAPPELREQLQGLTKMALIERCAGLRPGPVDSPLAAAKHALRALARRWRDLHTEITEHETLLNALVRDTAPQLVEAFGIGGGHRQANAAIYRTVIVRMRHHNATRAYVARRTTDGRTKAEIIRCLKRYVAREIWALLKPLRAPEPEPITAG